MYSTNFERRIRDVYLQQGGYCNTYEFNIKDIALEVNETKKWIFTSPPPPCWAVIATLLCLDLPNSNQYKDNKELALFYKRCIWTTAVQYYQLTKFYEKKGGKKEKFLKIPFKELYYSGNNFFSLLPAINVYTTFGQIKIEKKYEQLPLRYFLRDGEDGKGREVEFWLEELQLGDILKKAARVGNEKFKGNKRMVDILTLLWEKIISEILLEMKLMDKCDILQFSLKLEKQLDRIFITNLKNNLKEAITGEEEFYIEYETQIMEDILDDMHKSQEDFINIINLKHHQIHEIKNVLNSIEELKKEEEKKKQEILTQLDSIDNELKETKEGFLTGYRDLDKKIRKKINETTALYLLRNKIDKLDKLGNVNQIKLAIGSFKKIFTFVNKLNPTKIFSKKYKNFFEDIFKNIDEENKKKINDIYEIDELEQLKKKIIQLNDDIDNKTKQFDEKLKQHKENKINIDKAYSTLIGDCLTTITSRYFQNVFRYFDKKNSPEIIYKADSYIGGGFNLPYSNINNDFMYTSQIDSEVYLQPSQKWFERVYIDEFSKISGWTELKCGEEKVIVTPPPEITKGKRPVIVFDKNMLLKVRKVGPDFEITYGDNDEQYIYGDEGNLNVFTDIPLAWLQTTKMSKKEVAKNLMGAVKVYLAEESEKLINKKSLKEEEKVEKKITEEVEKNRRKWILENSQRIQKDINKSDLFIKKK